MGQLIGGALVGAIAASRGGGVAGFSAAFLVVGVVYLLLTASSLGLKGRAAELETVRRNEAARAEDLEVAQRQEGTTTWNINTSQ